MKTVQFSYMKKQNTTCPYSRIFTLAQQINRGPGSTKVDVNYFSVDEELIVAVYPSQWVNDPTVIKHLHVTEKAGNMIMYNQIRVVENYLESLI